MRSSGKGMRDGAILNTVGHVSSLVRPALSVTHPLTGPRQRGTEQPRKKIGEIITGQLEEFNLLSSRDFRDESGTLRLSSAQEANTLVESKTHLGIQTFMRDNRYVNR